MKKIGRFFFLFLILLNIYHSKAQKMPVIENFPALPDPEGMAGMYAGRSNGSLFCMGGANFPDKKPWEGGKKIWYDWIFRLTENKNWVKMDVHLPGPLAYGITVEFKDEIIIVGGNDDKAFHQQVYSLEWNGKNFNYKEYPSLPVPLANMAGALVNNIIVVAGGTNSFTGTPVSDCYALDLEHIGEGWTKIESWPGPARTQPVAGSFGNHFYLFSGEAIGTDHEGKPRRLMLQDAYRLRLNRDQNTLKGVWEKLSILPKAVSASANPVPVNEKGEFVFWGGVDASVAFLKDPVNNPGTDRKIFRYDSVTDTWSYEGVEEDIPSRVTLPAVLWEGYWLYISGEVKPGVRTNKIVGFKNN